MDSVHHFWVYRGVKTCEVFLCFLAIYYMYVPWLYCVDFPVASLYSLFYVTREFHRFLHWEWASLSVIPLTIFVQLQVFMLENLYPRIQVWQRYILLCLQNLSKMHKSCELGELERHFMEFGFWFQSWYIIISVLHYYRTVNLFLVCFDIIDKNVGNLVTI